MSSFDLVIIGSGPGGYVSAIRAAQLGLKVAIVEKESLGGVCLNWGCIPTKALLKSAQTYKKIKDSEEFGIKVSKVEFDFDKIISRSRDVSKKLNQGVAGLMKKNKIEVIYGFAKFVNQNTIEVLDENQKVVNKIDSKYFIIATGSRARTLNGYEMDEKYIWYYRQALVAKKLPKSIAVVGSGAIGMEFAWFYNSLGVKVTVLEAMDRILITEDAEISAMARKSFEKQGITFHAGVSLKGVEKHNSTITTSFEENSVLKSIETEKVIMAVGVVCNTEGMNLEGLGIELDKNKIAISPKCETNVNNILAIGDVTNSTPWLAHKASHEGIIAAEVVASKLNKYDGKKIHAINKLNIPACIYTNPQIASVGLTEEKAIELGKKIKVGKFSGIANGKSIASNSTDNFVKVIFDEKTGELLGAHLFGEEVTEMIQGFVVGKQAELTEEDFISTIYPHPTVSEMIHEAVLAAFGRVIHA